MKISITTTPISTFCQKCNIIRLIGMGAISGAAGCEGSVKRTESIGSQWTRIPRRGLEEGQGKDTSIYVGQGSKRAPD